MGVNAGVGSWFIPADRLASVEVDINGVQATASNVAQHFEATNTPRKDPAGHGQSWPA
jgi:hypothetical protein